MDNFLNITDKPFAEIATDEDLEHYGILGMKWGVRRDRKTLNKLAGRDESGKFKKPAPAKIEPSKKEPSSDADRITNFDVKAARYRAKKQRRVMTIQEVKSELEKLKLETEMAKLINDDIAPARAFMGRIAKDVAKQTMTNVGTTVATGLLTYAIRASLEKKFDAAEAAKYLMPKKK